MALQRSTTPLNLADLRLHDVVSWHASGRRLVHHSLAERSDLSIGRALRAADARRSRQFTEFDGNLGAIAAESMRIGRPFAADGGASSATSVERWAGCPFLYFMVNVLRVEATERPEDEWTVTPLDKGSLVHAVLEQFFRERFEPATWAARAHSRAADHDRLDDIAWTHLHDLEDQGRTGHPLAWDNARAVIVKDLHVLLEREDAWRTEDGLEPALFERTFGDSRDPDTWPAVVVPLQNGLEVRFRGAMDRVDFSPTGADRRALVIDYKTGGAWGYEGLAEDPVLAGRHVQLALYARALRGGLAGGPDAWMRSAPSTASCRARADSSDARSSWTTEPMPAWSRWCSEPPTAFAAASSCPGQASAAAARSRIAASARTTASARQPATRPGGGSGRTPRSCRWSVSSDSPSSAARRRLRTKTRARGCSTSRIGTFFVEAGAGTGKTTIVVGRIVNLVAAGHVSMEYLAAITFTEAAAAELRDRVREGLERGASDTSRDDDQRARCLRAVSEIDLAAISTIHAFAAQLLRTYPLEAGLPPGFATLDEIEQEFLFDERFKAWFWRDALREPARTVVKRALLLGLGQERMRALAARLEETHHLLRARDDVARGRCSDPHCPCPTPSAQGLLALNDWMPYAQDGSADPLVQTVAAVQSSARVRWCRRVPRKTRLEHCSDSASCVSGSNIPTAGTGCQIGRNAAWATRGVLQAASADVMRVLDSHRSATLAAVLELLRDFVLDGVRQRRSDGVATFHDLLAWARDLLRDNREVRHGGAGPLTSGFSSTSSRTPIHSRQSSPFTWPPTNATGRRCRRTGEMCAWCPGNSSWSAIPNRASIASVAQTSRSMTICWSV